jgi:hypothetical protein
MNMELEIFKSAISITINKLTEKRDEDLRLLDHKLDDESHAYSKGRIAAYQDALDQLNQVLINF